MTRGRAVWNRLRRRVLRYYELLLPGYARTLSIENETDKSFQVFIEMNPNRYIMHPKEKMEIKARISGAQFSITSIDGDMTIFAGDDSEPVVLINGVELESDWHTPLPSR